VRTRAPRTLIPWFPSDLTGGALLLGALLSIAAGASLIGQQGPLAALAGAGRVLVLTALALVLGIVIIVLLVAD
jgi:hypothetical protein